MQDTHTVSVVYITGGLKKLERFVCEPLSTKEGGGKGKLSCMDLHTIHLLRSTLQASIAQLNQEILLRAKQGLTNIGLKRRRRRLRHK